MGDKAGKHSCGSILLFPFALSFLKTKLIFREKKGEAGRERDIDLLFHVFMHSLVTSCVCPDQELHPQPWYMGWCSNQPSYPARALHLASSLSPAFNITRKVFYSSCCCRCTLPPLLNQNNRHNVNQTAASSESDPSILPFSPDTESKSRFMYTFFLI